MGRSHPSPQNLRLNVCSSATSECVFKRTLDPSQESIAHVFTERREGVWICGMNGSDARTGQVLACMTFIVTHASVYTDRYLGSNGLLLA
jgi:hypothetical protein